MRLRRLRLQSIRSYDRADLAFDDGTTLIAGDVGSGKTSLLYALEMALFGFAEVEPAFLIRHQAIEAEVALTLREDGHDHELRRRFKRHTRKGRDVFEPVENSYAVDGQRMVYSATELRQRAIDLLGFPDNPNPRAHSDLWRWAVYIPQERMREVLQQEPQERLETVRKALGLEQYRTAAENAQVVAVELRRRIEAKRELADRLGHWADSLPPLLAHEQELGAAYDLALSATAEGRAALSSAESRSAELETILRRAEADEQQSRQLREESTRDESERHEASSRSAAHLAEVTRLEGEAAMIAHRLETVPTLRSERAALLTERGRLREVAARAETLERQLAAERALETAAARAQGSAARETERAEAERLQREREAATVTAEGPLQAPVPPTARSVDEIDEASRHERARAEALDRELARFGRDVEEVDQLLHEGVCPRCHQRVEAESFGHHRDELAGAVARLTEERRAVKQREIGLAEERQARERFDRANDRWADLERRRSSAREAFARAALRRAEAGESEGRGSAELARLTASIRDLEAKAAPLAGELATLARCEQRIETLDQEVGGLELQAVELRADQERMGLLRTEAGRLDGRVAELGARATQRAEQLGQLQQRLASAAEHRGEAQALRALLLRLRRQVEDGAAQVARLDAERRATATRVAEAQAGERERLALTEESDRLDRLQGWLVGPFATTVLDVERKLLQQARGEFDRSFSRYFSTLIEDPSLVARSDPQFSPMVEVDGEWTPAEALSGGERTALALAFRLALGRVVRGLGRLKLETMILDEPTDGFSPEQVVRMGELLGELELPQIILVSHEAQLTGIADRVVRVTKVNGSSRLQSGETSAAEPAPSVSPPATKAPAPRRRAPRPRRTLDGIAAP